MDKICDAFGYCSHFDFYDNVDNFCLLKNIKSIEINKNAKFEN